MVTIQQVLAEIPLLTDARVVAGASGLEREIGWPQIVDIPGVADWLDRGDLLLTTAFVLREPATEQRALVRALHERGVVGAFVSVGRYMSRVPAVMREVAERVHFPLIELPWQVPLMEVSQQISRRIVGEHRELLSQSLEIHQTLTHAVAEGLGLGAVAEILARLVGASVTIEDADLRVMAAATAHDVDPARRWSLAHGHTPRAILERLRASRFFEDLARQPRPVRVGPFPDLGMTAARVVAPIVAAREILGYVWVVVGERPITRLDYVAIEHGAMVAALILTRDRAVREARAHRQRDLLDVLLAGDPGQEAPRRDHLGRLAAASRLGLDPRRRYAVMLVRGDLASEKGVSRVEGLWSALVEQEDGHGLVGRRQGHVILVVDEALVDRAVEVVEALEPPLPTLIGVGEPVALGDLGTSYAQAWEATEIAERLGERSGMRFFRSLGILHWLYHLPPAVREANPYLARVRELARSHPTLLETLEAYLDRGANAVQTARDLYLHRSTLLYRLRRASELLEVNLADPEVSLNLHVALKAYRLGDES